MRAQLLVEALDPSGNVVQQTVQWVGSPIPPGSRVYFEVPAPGAAPAYRVSVFAFDWLQTASLETPQRRTHHRPQRQALPTQTAIPAGVHRHHLPGARRCHGGARESRPRRGKVGWISATQMLVIPVGGLPVTVDLSRVDLDQYYTLMSGDWVIVDGTPTPDGKRLVATAVQRVER